MTDFTFDFLLAHLYMLNAIVIGNIFFVCLLPRLLLLGFFINNIANFPIQLIEFFFSPLNIYNQKLIVGFTVRRPLPMNSTSKILDLTNYFID